MLPWIRVPRSIAAGRQGREVLDRGVDLAGLAVGDQALGVLDRRPARPAPSSRR